MHSSIRLSVVSTLHGNFFFPDMLPGDSFRERLVSLKRIGFDSVEIWGRGLKEEFDAIKSTLKKENVTVSAICSGFRGNLLAGDRDERMTCFEDFHSLLELSAKLDAAGLVFVPIFAHGPQMPSLEPLWNPAEVENRVFLDMLGKLTARAETLGTNLLLEPVNRYETHVCNRLEQGAAFCQQVGSKHLKLTADFYHMNIEEADIAESIRRHGNHIGHVHMVDSNRFLPGQGHTQFAPAINALKEIGYRGHLSLECFAKGDPESALTQSVSFMRKLIQ